VPQVQPDSQSLVRAPYRLFNRLGVASGIVCFKRLVQGNSSDPIRRMGSSGQLCRLRDKPIDPIMRMAFAGAQVNAECAAVPPSSSAKRLRDAHRPFPQRVCGIAGSERALAFVDQMQIELRSPLRNSSFAVVCLVFVGLYLQWARHAYLASHLTAVPDSPNLQEAIRLEPSNAEYRDLLGRNLALSGESLDEAIANYRIAVHLNPYVAQYWLDLAGAYQVAGRTREQEESVERAVDADPTTPHVAWDAANFFLIQGDREKALRYFRAVLANDPDPNTIDSALQLCWRATEDTNQILAQALPERPDLYVSFLRLLISKQEVAAAENVWNHLIGLNQAFPSQLAFPYFRFLIAQQEVAAAQTAWQQLAVLDRSLQPYLPSPENLIVNGGFEENLLGGGFDWWYESRPHVILAIDTSEFRSGTRSLSITFDGQSASEAGISQFIPVKPNTGYEFSAEYRAEELETASGPRFAIADAYSGASYVLTDEVMGTNPWRLQQARFQTGPKTNLVLLKIVRQPAAQLIRGKLWIDDLRLVEK
jgi:tetratricopeptide (TPR) repeat protein